MVIMGNDKLIESTLSFQFEAQDYEDAAEHPTYYRALNRDPRLKHPFHIYEDILRQHELVAATLEAIPSSARRMAEAFAARGLQRVIFSGVGASYHLAASAAQALWEISVLPASGDLLPNAWEIALRFEEMSHFPARGRPLVDFLHGGVGFLAPDILTLLLAPPGNMHTYALRAARVTQIVKTPCIAFLERGHDTEIAALVDNVLRIPGTHPALRPLLYILPGKLLSYYSEVARPGGNPEAQRTDEPRYARAFEVAMPPGSH
jgi:glucosamine 6-phosphate synthetase-like amidotransferase/phosphosugar isomerase protein